MVWRRSIQFAGDPNTIVMPARLVLRPSSLVTSGALEVHAWRDLWSAIPAARQPRRRRW